ncbi:branched-chain amino acid ABC transporter permease [Cereibacter azotoformans]|uniref:Amino acid/amide ABC transporter membrane protein 2 (HAAT family) n=1 Tax=Cereibacter azotoformans TaxID=43057 RepID=A0A2T5KA32_9RHOB|nr:branched-chain amino acid ABC transporter permease [Cereibacter azotoformans]AXQ95297.1 branched-chain amino acid ABC transporter permease [Cereibacter sphaeroides]PTR19271.1 amino acid/amide ABC transporter membrane protein 2 (HAAT family) [Cereibacter azotoformans]UIJ32478.1 branched-chain amino acid ABC transporter permease [Cereibacter azotoformans]
MRPLSSDRVMAGLLLLLLPMPAVFAALGEPFLTVVLTRALIFAIAALSLDLILGFGAMVSFGHAAYLGIGAYAAGILAANGITGLEWQVPVALAAAGVFALVTGAISLRTRGVHFIMITLAFGQMAYFLMSSLSAFGGDDGMTLAARSTLFGAEPFNGTLRFFYTTLALLAALWLGLRAVTRSRFGRVLAGTRENEIRMQAIGFSPFAYRLTAYALSGMIAALAGVLLANHAAFVSPSYMGWARSGEMIAMVVLGGMGTLTGPVLGALAFILSEEALARFTTHWRLPFGAAVVLAVLFTRGGLLGALKGRGRE